MLESFLVVYFLEKFTSVVMRMFRLFTLAGIASVLAVPLERRADYAIHSEHVVPPAWQQLDTPRPVYNSYTLNPTVTRLTTKLSGSYHRPSNWSQAEFL